MEESGNTQQPNNSCGCISGVLAFIIILAALITFGSNGCGSSLTDSSSEISTPSVPQSNGAILRQLDEAPEEETAEYEQLLSKVAQAFPADTEQGITDMTVTGWQLCKQKGKPVTLKEFLKGMLKLGDVTKLKASKGSDRPSGYAEASAMMVTIWVNSRN